MKKRVLIIGLDGFTWRVGKLLMKEACMPHLGELVKSGVHGILKSVVPCETSPSWSSLQTGCLPQKTGIWAFHRFDRHTSQIKLNNYNDIRVPTLWQLLSDSGKRIVSINMPMTSPPPHVNGIMIPGLTCPEISAKTVYPPDVYDTYINRYPLYRIVHKEDQPSLRGYVTESINTEKTHCHLALDLMKEVDWDVFSIEIQSTDFFQHQNWWALDPSSNGFTSEDFKTAALFYIYLDNMIKQIMSAAGEETLTFIVSDHGFCGKNAGFGINSWLLQNNYLSLLQGNEQFGTWDRLKRDHPFLKKIAKLYGDVNRRVSGFCKDSQGVHLYAETVMEHIRRILDLDRTTAFCLGGLAGLLYINPRRKTCTSEIVEALLRNYGPSSGHPLISGIEPLNSQDPCTPDYMITLLPGVVNQIEPTGPIVLSGDYQGRQMGTHEADGIFIISGNAINSRSQLNQAQIIDIAPTVLAYMDVPVPDHMDGHVLEQVFMNPLAVSYTKSASVAFDRSGYSDFEQSVVEKQLRDLGYL